MTDTEVIIHGYEEYGAALLGKLRGMFAFVIWDNKKKCFLEQETSFGINHSIIHNWRRPSFWFRDKIIPAISKFKKEVNEKST